MVALEFWLPMPPKETNRSGHGHWSKGVKEKNAFLRELNWRAMAKFHVPPVPAAPIDPARLEACFYFRNRHHFMDRDKE